MSNQAQQETPDMSENNEPVEPQTQNAESEQISEESIVENINPDAIQALLASKDAEIAELKDQHLRALAEIENLRRRAERDQSDTAKYAIVGFARELTDVLDNLKRAADAVSEEARKEHHMLDTIAVGVEMTLKSLTQAFEKNHIKRIDPVGEKFDHNQHQAVSKLPSADEEPGTILQVMQAGYMIHDRLLKPAMVVVAAPVAQTDTDTSQNNAQNADDDKSSGTQIDTSA